MQYLTQFHSEEWVMEMNRTFPPLLDLNVSRHIHPKFRFLNETLLIMDVQKATTKNIFDEIPPQYLVRGWKRQSLHDMPSWYIWVFPMDQNFLLRNQWKTVPRKDGKNSWIPVEGRNDLLSCAINGGKANVHLRQVL
jgi:hypothetical protein